MKKILTNILEQYRLRRINRLDVIKSLECYNVSNQWINDQLDEIDHWEMQEAYDRYCKLGE